MKVTLADIPGCRLHGREFQQNRKMRDVVCGRLHPGFPEEEIMGVRLRVLGTCLVMGLGGWAARQSASQEKPKEPARESTQDKSKEAPAAEAAGKKNPVKATVEVLAAAKKVFGYDCAMCHGEKADCKGEMGESMNLVMKECHESSSVYEMSDEAIYDLIVKGKDTMVGEADQLKTARVWGLVHYVRTMAKKKGA